MDLHELCKVYGMTKVAMTIGHPVTYLRQLRCGQSLLRGIHLYKLQMRFPEFDMVTTVTKNVRNHNRARLRQGMSPIL